MSLTRQESAPDNLDNARFELLLGTIPGGGSTTNFTLGITTTSYPGWGNETWEAPVNGHIRKFRGRKTYPRTLSVTYNDFVTFENTTKLRQWNEFIVGTDSGNSSGYRVDYSINADLIVYDVTGVAIDDTTMWKMFLNDLPDVTVDGQASAGFTATCTFSYDYTTSNNVAVL